MNRKKIIIPIILFTFVIIFLLIVSDTSQKYSKISVSQDKWNSIQDTRNENKNLVLETIKFNDYNLIIDESNNTLYYSLVMISQSKYNPRVSYSSQSKNVKLVILSDEITDEKVKNGYKFKIMIYNENEYHIYDLICTNLPIVNIKYKEDVGNNQKNIPIEIYIFNNLTNAPNKITISNGKFKISENNYIFSLNMITPGKNIRDNRISILNMKPDSEYILVPIENNENITLEHSRGVKKVELFINSEYKGIYSIENAPKDNK